MKPRFLVVFIILLIGSFVAYGQDQRASDTLQFKPGAWTFRNFKEGNNRISGQRVSALLKSHPDAYALLKKSRANRVATYVAGFVGGGLAGFSAASLLYSEQKTASYIGLGVGAGLSVFSFNLEGRANKRAREAARAYNALQ